jgi:hypothetical protein
MDVPYKPTLHQAPLTKLLTEQPFPEPLNAMPSFQRLRRAVKELVDGMQSGKHVVTPADPNPPTSAPRVPG